MLFVCFSINCKWLFRGYLFKFYLYEMYMYIFIMNYCRKDINVKKCILFCNF